MGATDSKMAFKKGVFRLFEERNILPTDDDYWSLFWKLPGSIRDVHDLIDATDIMKTRDTAIENLETLFDKLIDHLDQLVYSKTPVRSIEILNCCRIITRIMPFIFESTDYIEWEEKYFWTSSKPRGNRLISLAVNMLFLSSFTLPQSLEKDDSQINYVIWETGVAASTPIFSSRENEWNRIEILRLIVVLLSKSLYQNTQNRWLQFIVTELDKKATLALLCSILNTCCKFNPISWSVNALDQREQLVAYCLHVLVVLMEPSMLSTKADGTLTFSFVKSQKEMNIKENAFKYYLSRLHRIEDFQFLMDGIHRVLSSPMQTLNASNTPSKYHEEMITLCWKLLELNHRFTNYIIYTERALDLMIMLLFYVNQNKLQQQGPTLVCLYILQELSSNEKFAIELNKTFKGHYCLPADMRIPNFLLGSYADYLILSIYSIIVSIRGVVLSPHYSALMKIIVHISPFLENLSKLTSSKLMSLFGLLSTPSFLLADKNNYQLVQLLHEAINNMIDFQLEFKEKQIAETLIS